MINDMRLRLRTSRLLIVFTVMILFVFVLYFNKSNISSSFLSNKAPESYTVHLVAVSCGRPDYLGRKDFRKPFDQTLTMLKSAVLFAKSKLHIHIFTEDEMKELFKGEIQSWPLAVRARIEYSLYDAEYSDHLPEKLVSEWKKWYKPCGSFRLFLPMIMHEITEAAIYADSDVIFVKPIDELWTHLYKMNSKNVAAISPTAGHPLGGSAENVNFINHPSGLFQINSGVMLLNFRKILEADWKLYEGGRVGNLDTAKYGVDLLLAYYKQFKDAAEHDQKLLNIMYHYNPDLLYQLPCCWNFKTNFCVDDKNVCASAEDNGACAVHGIAGGFFSDTYPPFKGLYETFLPYDFDADLESSLFQSYLNYLDRGAKSSYCEKKAHIITDSLRGSIKDVSRW